MLPLASRRKAVSPFFQTAEMLQSRHRALVLGVGFRSRWKKTTGPPLSWGAGTSVVDWGSGT
jgi:hypothetical protein